MYGIERDQTFTYSGSGSGVGRITCLSTEPDPWWQTSELHEVVQAVVEELVSRGSADPVHPSVLLDGQGDVILGDGCRTRWGRG